jgi:hypothetical protein
MHFNVFEYRQTFLNPIQPKPTLNNFLNIFFWRDLPLLAVFIIFVFPLSSGLYPSNIKMNTGVNPHPRTMAQTVSPRCSPLDQGALHN